MNRILASASALALTGLALGGCGGADGAPTSTAATPRKAPTADQMRARTSLLRDADLPAGWVSGEGSPRERCRSGGTFAGVTGRSASDAFTRGNVDVQQSVWIFRDATDAQRAFRTMNARSGRACFRLQVTARMLDQASVIVEPLRVVRQRRRLGIRRSLLTGKISRLVESPFGQVQTLMAVKVDEIERRAGRGISTIVVTAAAERPDRSTVQALIAIAGRRLNAATASGS